jgi:hypothetical protein
MTGGPDVRPGFIRGECTLGWNVASYDLTEVLCVSFRIAGETHMCNETRTNVRATQHCVQRGT